MDHDEEQELKAPNETFTKHIGSIDDEGKQQEID